MLCAKIPKSKTDQAGDFLGIVKKIIAGALNMFLLASVNKFNLFLKKKLWDAPIVAILLLGKVSQSSESIEAKSSFGLTLLSEFSIAAFLNSAKAFPQSRHMHAKAES